VFVNEYRGLELTCKPDEACPYQSGDDVVEFWNMDDVKIWRSFLFLLVILAVYRVLTYIGLRWVAPRTSSQL